MLRAFEGFGCYFTIIGMMRRRFPDIQWTLEEVIPEGDKGSSCTLHYAGQAPRHFLRCSADREENQCKGNEIPIV